MWWISFVRMLEKMVVRSWWKGSRVDVRVMGSGCCVSALGG
jgi:hypothetical protein